MIRPASPRDAEQIRGVYNHYVETTVITFEEQPVSPQDMARRISEGTASYPWLVCERDGEVLGYAYAAPWRPRSAYRYSVETTVYVSPEYPRQGIGGTLYRALVERLAPAGFHCAIGSIALPNPASVALHEKCGFVKLGELKEVGRKHGRWVDVGYWQLLL